MNTCIYALPEEVLKKQLEEAKSESNANVQFSLAFFDRHTEIFNLGNERSDCKAVEGEWFISLLDVLRDISNMSMKDFRTNISRNKTYDPHPPDWGNSNTPMPLGSENMEWFQFRLNKSKGRVYGIIVDAVFYIVWLDRYHNFQDSDGYDKCYARPCPFTEYEQIVFENEQLKKRIEYLESETKTYEEIFNNKV